MKRLALYLILLLLGTLNSTAADYQYDSGGGFLFTWQTDDAIGIYTSSGTLIKHWATDVDDNGATSKFSSYGWSLTSSHSYYLYSPFNDEYLKENCDLTALPVSYIGQKQTTNNDLSGMAAYDFMMGKGESTADKADFTMNHVGALLRIVYSPKKTMTFTKIALFSESHDFVKDAKMNLQTQTLEPTSYTDNISLELNNIKVSSGDCLEAHMMVAPTNLTGKNLTLVLYYDEGNTTGNIKMSAEAGQLKAGHIYGINTNVAAASHSDRTMTKGTLAKPTVTTADFVADSEGITTSVRAIDDDTTTDGKDGNTYTLSGIKVNNPQPGNVYIHKGKKIISK